jgi:ribosomal protein L7/L12
MIRELTQDEHEKIAKAIFDGDRVEAITIFISTTRCGLTEAQDFVKLLTTELKESSPAKFVRKKQGKSHWVRQSIA